MRERAKSAALMRALAQLMPDGEISIIHQRPWHSLTFSGVQICLSARLYGPDMMHLGEGLTEHEFNLPGQIVADIAVTKAVLEPGAYCLIIDALLLDD